MPANGGSHPFTTLRLFQKRLAKVWLKLVNSCQRAFAVRKADFRGGVGIEAEKRAGWMNYIFTETKAAMDAGVPVEGICLYSIVNQLGWDDDRHCENGLLSSFVSDNMRSVYEPLARVLKDIHADIERADW